MKTDRGLRTGIRRRQEKAEGQLQHQVWEGARQVEAKIPLADAIQSRGEGLLVRWALGSVLGPIALSPAAPPSRLPAGLLRKAHRYLNFDFILFYFISLLPRAGAVPPGTAAPRPPPRASLYYCNKCAYKGAGSRARCGGVNNSFIVWGVLMT